MKGFTAVPRFREITPKGPQGAVGRRTLSSLLPSPSPSFPTSVLALVPNSRCPRPGHLREQRKGGALTSSSCPEILPGANTTPAGSGRRCRYLRNGRELDYQFLGGRTERLNT